MSASLNNMQSFGVVTTLPLHAVFKKGIEAVWTESESAEFQRIALTAIVKNSRKVNENDVEKTVQYLKDLGAFYVPNDDYMATYFGQEVRDYRYGLYHGGGGASCKYYKRLAIPLRTFDGTILGFCGFSDGTSEGEDPNGADHIKYLYPMKDVFKKEAYMFIERNELSKAIEDGYIMITDGLFDKISLQMQGYNAVSLCGSALTEWHKLYLFTVKNKIVLPDNDAAGKALANKCKRNLKGTVQIKQGAEWDVDDWLKTRDGREQLRRLFKQSIAEGFIRDLTAVRRKPNILETPQLEN